MMMPTSCPNVPADLLSPRHAWSDEHEYDVKARQLAGMFVKNFEKYASGVNEEILAAAPTV
jgi:phosphoenolpyruvate carboxykinase (ATP)